MLVRITPAWAGKRAPSPGGLRNTGDHPRVGGEKAIFHPLLTIPKGSPPRGRGKAPTAGRWVQGTRITPAWAGKSRAAGHHGHRRQDHPRVGGEKTAYQGPVCCNLGSPPRGRGKDMDTLQTVHDARITPAWAGKRLKRSHRSGIFISGPIPFHSVLHRPAGSGGSRAGRDGSLAGQPQNAGPA